MLVDHIKKTNKYSLGLLKSEKQKTAQEIDPKLNNRLLIEGNFSEAILYKLSAPNSEKYSFITLVENTNIKNNFIKVPDKIFSILNECKEISFEYQPRTSISEIIKQDFKTLIDKTISIIEIIYHVMTKLYNTSNFDIYLSLMSNALDKHSTILNTYSQIIKAKQRLGNNLNYILLSPKNVGFGMIDPEGCLLLQNEQFNYKKIVFKPVISIESPFEHNIDAFKKNISKNSDEYLEQIVSSDIVNKWTTKLIEKTECLFIIDTKHFIGANGIKNKLENLGYNLMNINITNI